MNRQEFKSLTQSKIVILDGATGSNLQIRGMKAGVCPEKWMLENKDAVIDLQEEFLEAGSDIIFAPTFTANRIKLKEYGLEDQIEYYNRGLVQLSREAIKSYQKKTGDKREVYIAADITMTGEQLYPVGELAFEELVEVYKEQIRIVLDEGVDLFIIETMMSLQECRAALLAVKEICDLPVMVSLTFAGSGRTLYGTDPKTAMIVLQAMGADAVGVNCSTGPEKMHNIIREMKQYAYIPIIAKPNAGIPQLINNKTVFPMEAEEFAEEMEKLISEGAGLVGGCCGTTPKHIRLLADKARSVTPQPSGKNHIRALTTERNTVEIRLDGPFMVVGERINPTGKKLLQEQLRAGNLSMVEQMAADQVGAGANILDINVGMGGIDEKEMMFQVMEEVLRTTDTPLSIDSSNINVIEAALRVYPGRALINSISLEKEKFERLIPTAKKYGAMFILLPLSEHGLPKNIEEKKQIINTIRNRAYELGLTGEDIITDGLVTTVGANKNAALETIETIRYCREELGLATIVGLSNISFGLPERQYINSTFLSFAIQAGLSMAIANPSQELLMNTAYAADLLLGKETAANRYIERVTAKTAAAADTVSMPKQAEAIPGTDENIKNTHMDTGVSDSGRAADKDMTDSSRNRGTDKGLADRNPNSDVGKDLVNRNRNWVTGKNVKDRELVFEGDTACCGIGRNAENGSNMVLKNKKDTELQDIAGLINDIDRKPADTKIGKAITKAVMMGNQKEIVALTDQFLDEKVLPGDIIEQILIPAINEVGALFDRQIYFLPQLIASAQTMKLAVEHLQPMLSGSGEEKKHGTIIIATVKGDIHDIGKNLVTLMLKNYGYRVVDLGKDVASRDIVEAAKKECADIIALSALMTTTMIEMKQVIALVKESGLRTKVIIGGAVITEGYAKEIGADGYSADAQSAVALVRKLLEN